MNANTSLTATAAGNAWIAGQPSPKQPFCCLRSNALGHLFPDPVSALCELAAFGLSCPNFSSLFYGLFICRLFFFHNFNIPFDECQHQNLFFKDTCVQMGESVISCPRSVSPFPICFSSFLVLDGKRCRNTRNAPKPVQEEAKKGDERSIGEDRSSPFPADPCLPWSGPILDPRQVLFAGFRLGTCTHFYRLAFLCWRDMV